VDIHDQLAALILIEQGKLDLSDPASKYLPQLSDVVVLEGFMKTPTPTPRPSQGSNPITILHLLTHTSGSTYFAKPREPSYGLGMGYTFEQVGGRERAQEEFLEHIKVRTSRRLELCLSQMWFRT
jgi:CubicO group peptidase (beta-lactamase class C family)